MITKKLYYEDMFLTECKAKITEISGNRVILDQTVAFPEGGGQIGDKGVLIVDGKEYVFSDTQKGPGKKLRIPDFPSIEVDTPIYHIVDTGIEELKAGDEVTVRIDVEHRIMTTVYHSALHIALMAAQKVKPESSTIIKGCSITADNARIDFFCEEKFQKEEIEEVKKIAKEIVERNSPVERINFNGMEDAWIWKCEDFSCPCGGTHVTSTGQVGELTIKRKNVGKTTERFIVNLENVALSKELFHA